MARGMMKRKGPSPNMSAAAESAEASAGESKVPDNVKRTALMVVHLNIVLYALCYWIQTNALPYLSKTLGASTAVFGYLQTTFAVVQLAGGPLYGRFGDLFGARLALCIAGVGSAACYLLLGSATTVTMLFLSRLPSMLQHSMQGAQMAVTDVTTEKERAAALGKLSLSYGIGMVCGPLIGGWISEHHSNQAAALTAGFGSLASVAMVYFLLPATRNGNSERKKSDDAAVGKSSGGVFDRKTFTRLLSSGNVASLLFTKLCYAVPFGVFQSMFAIVSMNQFGLSAQQNGWVLSYVGMVGIFVQGFVVGQVTKRFSDAVAVRASVCGIALAFAAMTFVETIVHLCLVLVPLLICGTLLATLITSNLTKAVPAEDTGSILGTDMAVNSLVRTMSPALGGYLLETFGFASLGVFGFCCNSTLLLLLTSGRIVGV